jgi:hypothetical protein
MDNTPDTSTSSADERGRDTPKGSQRTRRIIIGVFAGLALFLIVFSLSDLEMGIGRASIHPIHLVFALAIVLLFVYLFRGKKQSDSTDGCTQKNLKTAQSSNNMALLALAALVSGPVLAFTVGLICVLVFKVHPMDRGSIVFSVTALGLFVGALVAAILAVAGSLK